MGIIALLFASSPLLVIASSQDPPSVVGLITHAKVASLVVLSVGRIMARKQMVLMQLGSQI